MMDCIQKVQAVDMNDSEDEGDFMPVEETTVQSFIWRSVSVKPSLNQGNVNYYCKLHVILQE